MRDVLLTTGAIWQSLVRAESNPSFDVKIVAPRRRLFDCGFSTPVRPDCTFDDDPEADIVVITDIWLDPDASIRGRHPALAAWLGRRFASGASIYAACTGTLLLAESGLLDGRAATSHWGYQHQFAKEYPAVQFFPAPNLCFADESGRIVTAGGMTSWHDLAIHIIARHCSPVEALRISKAYLLKWHGEGELPYQSLLRGTSHSDSLVRQAEHWLAENYKTMTGLYELAKKLDVAERTLKRRFKAAMGVTLIEHVQNLRVEEAKRLLEQTDLAADDVSFEVGYEDPSFFRRLFKRRVGVSPGRYRRIFKPVMMAGELP